MFAKDFRREAWTKLNGKWGTAALIALIYSAIVGACSALSFYFVGAVAILLITGPLTLSWAIISMSVIRNKSIQIENLFDGFRDFSRSFVLMLLIEVFTALWSLLFIIPGIVKAYSYSMSFYILADNPELSANEARKRSMELMRGNKWRLFCLHFSFIGWLILCGLTFGILSFWVMPYMQASVAAFYRNITGQSDVPEADTKVGADCPEGESKDYGSDF